jgi:hypothetical protein
MPAPGYLYFCAFRKHGSTKRHHRIWIPGLANFPNLRCGVERRLSKDEAVDPPAAQNARVQYTMLDIPRIPLNNGTKIPAIGMGRVSGA